MSPRITNPKTLARMNTGLGEEEEATEYEDDTSGNSSFGDREEREYEEEIPEAFIPQFTIASEEVPPIIPSIPTEDEQKSTFEKYAKKIGIEIKRAMNEPPLPITPDKERFVQDTSDLAAGIFSAVMMWGFSIVGGLEYGVLAPSEEEANKIVRPIMRIVARHSKIVNTISPDYIDLKDSLKALSDYANVSMQILQQIREDKARNNGRITKTQVRPSHEAIRPDDIRGYPPTNNEHAQSDGSTDAEFTSNLTPEQQRNYEALQRLSQRDYEYRARRSGRL